MPEIKNTFMASKMNKDLDARLIPNGEYRDGQNISINKSEAADVGALENVFGNSVASTFNLTDSGLKVIGVKADNNTDSIYVFLTNYNDTSFDRISNPAPWGAKCYICSYNSSTKEGVVLVSGYYLNFSKTNPVIGISILENLLFWTDNRNQPRKINIDKALSDSSFYDSEDKISVAKYYPWKPIRFWKNVVSPAGVQSTMKDVVSEFLPDPQEFTITVVASNTLVTIGIPASSKLGRYCGTNPDPYTVTCVVYDSTLTTEKGRSKVRANGTSQAQFEDSIAGMVIGDVIKICVNPYYDSSFSGDEKFLTDKFIKLAYRFKFADNEYSLISPFSQSIFVPKQDGYIIGDTTSDSQEETIGESSIVAFFENKINEVSLQIDAPTGFNNFNEVVNKLQVEEIDIIYKDASESNFKILSTITKDQLVQSTDSTYEYIYKSEKPIRTLPEKEITRVYDKVPLRALSQESVGNRILYSNFVAKSAVPSSLTYNVSVDEKYDESVTGLSTEPYLRKEYQNHTLKQNRTYQVGVVLCDRYGRQSDTILSSEDDFISAGGSFGSFGGSTVFNNYRNEGESLFTYDVGGNPEDVWPGDSLKVRFKNQIPNTISANGYVGLYVAPGVVKRVNTQTAGTGWVPSATYNVGPLSAGDGTGLYLTIDVNISGETETVTVTDGGEGFTVGDTITIPEPVVSPSTDLIIEIADLEKANPLGWYTYKIVVKQQEQDYYNVYLPGILNDKPGGGGGSYDISNNKAYITLANDNINKVPRDLKQVGSQDLLFSSDVRLYGRVTNVGNEDNNRNNQYYPENISDRVVLIGTMKDIGLDTGKNGQIFNDTSTTSFYNISTTYNVPGKGAASPAGFPLNFNSSPLIGQVSTQKSIGVPGGNQDLDDQAPDFYNMTFELAARQVAVYETTPFLSNLDIYYETSTAGLISELNEDIVANDVDTPYGLEDLQFDLSEDDAPGTYVTNYVYPLNSGGAIINNINTDVTLIQALNGSGLDITNKFDINLQKDPVNNNFRMRTSLTDGNFVYDFDSPSIENYTFTFNVENGAQSNLITVNPPNLLKNVAPSWTNNGGATPWDIGNKQPQAADGIQYCLLAVLDGRNGSQDSSLWKQGLSWTLDSIQFYHTAIGIWRNYDPTGSGSPTLSNYAIIENTLQQTDRTIAETLLYNLPALTVSSTLPYSTPLNAENTDYRIILTIQDASGTGLTNSLTVNFTVTAPNSAGNTCTIVYP
tara:strand:- start:1759 stop:5439 length:3681 start_codon:yes stop_codon:yes gene_type:complete